MPASRLIDVRSVEYTERVFKFAVIEAFKGVKTSEIDVSVGEIRTSCYHTFDVGDTYLVYAFRSGERPLFSGYCSRTSGLSNAASDLHYIRELLRGVREARVYGSVIRRETVLEGNDVVERVNPLEGITILVEGEGKRFEVVTDQNGLFRLDQIPDGKYKARPLLSDGRYQTYLWAFEEFVLGTGKQPALAPSDPRKAVTTDFYLAWNNELHGRILDAEGNAIVGAKVAMLPHRDLAAFCLAKNYRPYFDNKFRFEGLTPGRYLLSVIISAPFQDKTKSTCIHYPGSATVEEAEPIEIGINQQLEGKDIRLPPGYVVRQIEGAVEWPDGKRAPRTEVVLAGSKDSVDVKTAHNKTSTGENGTFVILGFVGAEYWIYATSASSGKGEPLKINVEMTNEPVKLVIPFPKQNQ